MFCVSVSGLSMHSFQKLDDIGLQLIRSVSSLSPSPFYSAGTISIKIEVGDSPFPLTRLNFLLGHNLELPHIGALEKSLKPIHK